MSEDDSASEQAKIDAANQAYEQAQIDAANEAYQQAQIDAANQAVQDAITAEQAGAEAGHQAGGQAVQTASSQGGPSSTSLQTVVVSVGIIATLIAALAFVQTRPITTARRPAAASAPTATGSTLVLPATPPDQFQNAHVEVEYVTRQGDYLDHSIRYSATALLSNVRYVRAGQTVFDVSVAPHGSGTGDYRERGVSTPGGQPGCTVTREGPVTMQVKVVAEIKELSVKVQGPVQRLVQGDPDCGANVGTSNMTDVVCVFRDVDFAHGGTLSRRG